VATTNFGADRPHGKLLSLPNALSLARVPLAGVPWIAPDNNALLFACLGAAALTDWADGWLARRGGGGRPGDVGAWLDPLCDKAFVTSVAVLVLVDRRPPLWIALTLLAREMAQLPLVVLYHLRVRGRWRFDFRAGLLGKITTCCQFFALAGIALGLWLAAPFAAASGLFGLGAAGAYVRRFLRGRRRSVESLG
jgi:phosphatidylglycerophosphate synthase